MDMREYTKMQIERAKEHAAKHIDNLLDEVEEDHRHLTMSETKELKDMMWIIHMCNQMMTQFWYDWHTAWWCCIDATVVLKS